MSRAWKWPEVESHEEGDRLEREYGMPRPVAQTLARRGFRNDDSLSAFLNPRLMALADPMTLTDMDRAVERVWRAVDNRETIFVHGDYDVDGISGTAFVTRMLRAVGAAVIAYVPRRQDGYGLGPAGIDTATKHGATVLITVDTGVRSLTEIENAKAKGLDVVVLDHHEPSETLPKAWAVVNPLRNREEKSFQNLAAVGVAAKFMHAMGAARPSEALRQAYREGLQLVALGTVADVVPLTGENRILVSHGLAQLARSRWAGIKALKAVAGLNRKNVSATDVAFFVAPRLNAAGRMGEASDALALLLADDPKEAFDLAEKLERLNRERRQVEQKATAQAILAMKGRDPLPPAIVQWSNEWPAGIVGIVASRIVDRFHRPAFVIAMDGESGRGSARSRAGLSLVEALEHCDDLLVQHGGHAQAAGFEIREENLEAFRERLESLAGDAILNFEPEALEVDVAVMLDELSPHCVGWLERLSPFGRGNPEPLFGCEGALLTEPPTVVGKRHLRLSLTQGDTTVRAIAFNQGERIRDLNQGQKVDAVFHATFDSWRGGQNIQLVVKDIHPR